RTPDGGRDSLVHVGVNVPAPFERSITAALRRVANGGRIVIAAGIYHEPMLVVQRPVRIEGQPGAILDGGGVRNIMVVNADSVTIRGLVFRNTGASHVEDRSALRVFESADCVIENNRFTETFFALHLQRVHGCVIRGNTLEGMAGTQSATG